MAYRVSLAAPAEVDAYAAFERIREAAPMHAEKWLTRLFEAILSLDKLPTVALSFPKRESSAIRPVTCFTAKEPVFTESSFISVKKSGMCVCCEFGTLPATPSPSPMRRLYY